MQNTSLLFFFVDLWEKVFYYSFTSISTEFGSERKKWRKMPRSQKSFADWNGVRLTRWFGKIIGKYQIVLTWLRCRSYLFMRQWWSILCKLKAYEGKALNDFEMIPRKCNLVIIFPTWSRQNRGKKKKQNIWAILRRCICSDSYFSQSYLSMAVKSFTIYNGGTKYLVNELEPMNKHPSSDHILQTWSI